ATRPLLGCCSAYAALAGVFFLLLYWHMQPSVLPNPGMTVRFAPPGTRVEPLPRKMDAPELAAVQESAPSSEALAYDASHRTSAGGIRTNAAASVVAGRAVAGRRKYALQGVSFDRLLQDRHMGKSAVDAFGSVSGQKDQRHSPSCDQIGHGVHESAAQID